MRDLNEYFYAGYPALAFLSQEHMAARNAILKAQVNSEAPRDVYTFDTVRGLMHGDESLRLFEPTDAITWLDEHPQTCLITYNLDKSFDDHRVIQAIQNGVHIWKMQASTICLVSPTLTLPPEIEKYFQVIDVPYPTVEDIHDVQKQLIKEHAPEIEPNHHASELARGLTLFEAETVFSDTLIRGNIDLNVIIEAKKQMIKRTGVLEFGLPVPEDQLGGHFLFRKYIRNRMEAFNPGSTLPKIRSLLIYGPPGTGKSLIAKILASIFEVPLITMNPGALRNSLVGRTEELTLNAFKQLDAFGQSIVFMDEIEKFFNVGNLGENTGTTSGQFGIMLNQLQETRGEWIFAATCNRMDILPAELLRRFDALFFADLPTYSERKEIWAIMRDRHLKSLELAEEHVVRTKGYAGAEIEKIVKEMNYVPFDEALRFVTPVSQLAKDYVDHIRADALSKGARFTSDPEPEPDSRNTRKFVLAH